MKIDRNARIEKMTYPSGDGRDGRNAIRHVYIDRDEKSGKAVAVATDGKMLACVPVELEAGDAAGLVSVEALTKARKLAGKYDMVRFEANGCVKLSDGATFPRPDFQYPNWRQVFPSAEPIFRIALDAGRLLAVAQAMGTKDNVVTLEFTDDALGAIRVKARGEAMGLLMPVRLT